MQHNDRACQLNACVKKTSDYNAKMSKLQMQLPLNDLQMPLEEESHVITKKGIDS